MVSERDKLRTTTRQAKMARHAEAMRRIENSLAAGKLPNQVIAECKLLGWSKSKTTRYIQAAYQQWLYESGETGDARRNRRGQIIEMVRRGIESAYEEERRDYRAIFMGLSLLSDLEGMRAIPDGKGDALDTRPVLVQLNQFYFGANSISLDAEPKPAELPAVVIDAKPESTE